MKIIIAILSFTFMLVFSSPAFAVGRGEVCDYVVPSMGVNIHASCDAGLECILEPGSTTTAKICMATPGAQSFGKISPPPAISRFGFGAEGISKFLSNAIALFYVIATVVLVLMIIWGAFDWMISEGDKEKVANARNRILNAIIGILIFAAAFGIIRVLGQFTGFSFFQTSQTQAPAGRGKL